MKVMDTESENKFPAEITTAMDQEEAEDKISFECLGTLVDNAIKNKNISIIDKIEKENKLKYMQKYAELKGSFEEIQTGVFGLVLAVIAIGVSYILIGIPENQKEYYSFLGTIFLIFGALLYVYWLKWYQPYIKDLHKFVLKIQEKLP